MLGVVRGVPGDRAPISIRIVIWHCEILVKQPLGFETQRVLPQRLPP